MIELYYKDTDISFLATKNGTGMKVSYRTMFWFEIPDCNVFNVMEQVERLIESQSSYKSGGLSKFTYLMFADGRYKIGTSKDVHKRKKSIKTASPNVEIIAFTNKYSEKVLHSLFKPYRQRGEWFDLSGFGLNNLRLIFDDNKNDGFENVIRLHLALLPKPFVESDQSIKHERYLSFIMPFGKYKNIKLCELRNADAVGYLEWLKIQFTKGYTSGNYYHLVDYHINQLKENGNYPL